MSDPVGAPSRRRRKLGKRAETLSMNESFTLSMNESFLPEDVVIDILSRLSAKDVLRCRCVCRGWRDLSSTRDFTDLHFKCCVPMILKDTDPLSSEPKTMLDGCWEPARTRSTILKVYQPCQNGNIYFSQNGIIAARGGESRMYLVIYNPVYTDVVNITLEPFKGLVCGVFFHPVHQELCILWETYQPFQYKILNLESNPTWRDINNPCTPNRRISRIPPVLIGQYLYWLAASAEDYNSFSIVEYDIRKEEFRLIPLSTPISVIHNTTYEYNVNLVDIDGFVSVVQVMPLPSKDFIEINIWTLKDDEEQLWTSSNYIICWDAYLRNRFNVPKVVAFRNGELVLHSECRLYVYDLKLGTFRKFGRTYSSRAHFYSHVPSIVSLKNCKSDICIVEEDENSHRERGNGEEIQALS